jgi:hypothetical protein
VTVEDVRRLLNAGADKVSMNTAAVNNPQLVLPTPRQGRQRSASWWRSTPSRPRPAGWEVFTHGGRNNTGLDAVEWARKVESLGAGEILLTSMDRDGTKSGFDLALTRAVADAVRIPVIASGGVGTLEHLAEGVREGRADAVLAASIFHYGEHTVAPGQGADARARHRGEAVSENTRWLNDVVGRARPGAGDRAGGLHRRRADVRLDEPRGAAAHRRDRRSGLLVAFAAQTVAQGRGVRPCAEGARHPHRLRQRRRAAGSSRLAASPATPDATAASSRNISPTAVGRPSIRF